MTNSIDKLDALYQAEEMKDYYAYNSKTKFVTAIVECWPELRAFLEAYEKDRQVTYIGDQTPPPYFYTAEAYIALMAAIERETKDD